MADDKEVSPLDGLDSVESDVDVRELLSGDRPKGDNPILGAAAKLRESADGDDTEGQEEEESAESEEGKEDEDQADDAEQDGEEEQTEEEGGESEEEGEGETEEAEDSFKVTVPSLNPKGEKPIKLVLDGLNQEQHDIIAGHLHRSQQLGVVQEQLEVAREYETVSQFVQQNPLAAMLLLDREDRESDKPQGHGEKFATEWMRMNPEAALKAIQKLGFHDPDSLDPERLKERAETAELKAKGVVDKALTDVQGSVSQRRFVNETAAVLRRYASELAVTGEDLNDFMTLSAKRIKGVYDSRVKAGRDTRMTQSDIANIIQPVIQRFASTTTAPAPKGAKGPASAKGKSSARKGQEGSQILDLGKHFQKREETRARHAKVGSGKGSVGTARSITVQKFKGTMGVRAAAAKLRQT